VLSRHAAHFVVSPLVDSLVWKVGLAHIALAGDLDPRQCRQSRPGALPLRQQLDVLFFDDIRDHLDCQRRLAVKAEREGVIPNPFLNSVLKAAIFILSRSSLALPGRPGLRAFFKESYSSSYWPMNLTSIS